MPDGNSLQSEEISAAELRHWMQSDRSFVLLDVREQYERDHSLIEGSLHIPMLKIPALLTTTFPSPDQEIVIYCEHGIRSLDACRYLRQKGYPNVWSLAGGIEEWQRTERPGQQPDADPMARYNRQIRLPELGHDGQAKLNAARVLIVGAGGLGCPAALYLAAAGVGTIGIVDYDTVDQTNLHRQVLYTDADVGEGKAETAAARLRAANSQIQAVPFAERLTAQNAERIVRDFDMVVDGADNFATRYLVNDICLMLRKVNVHGSVERFSGQVAVFGVAGGPCYRCLHPDPPADGLVPSCADAGVLGVLPGIIGTLQATETIKLIIEQGHSLSGRVLHFDALAMRFEEFAASRRPDCTYCRLDTPFPGLTDYESLCGA